MGGQSKDHHHSPTPPLHRHNCWLTPKLITRTIYVLLPVAFLHFYLFPRPLSPPLPFSPTSTSTSTSTTISTSTSNPTVDPPPRCDFSDGRWVPSAVAPPYNGTSCATIKDGQNCMAHGRPDTGYLYWRWQPKDCHLPRFSPSAFLRLLRNRHLAFVGDSMARNQLESLLCLLSSGDSPTPPTLLYTSGDDNKFRRWRFEGFNATVSVYWSPFLVRGREKSPSAGLDHNELFLDAIDERWGSDLGTMDILVLSVGHWFLHPAVYYDRGGAEVLGCHYCPGLNHTEVGFYEIYRRAFRTALEEVAAHKRRGGLSGSSSRPYVVVTTFSPAHFEGEWDKAGACPRKEPFGEGERRVEGMDEEMRRRQVEEVGRAAEGVMGVEALDVTAMAMLRPDGHPGPYMHPDPFRDGVVPERVQNDCVHWCLPGPIDAWNEVFQQMISRWDQETQSRV